MKRQPTPLPKEIYPTEDWAIVETAYSPDNVGVTETLFTLSNGYLGLRGSLDFGGATHAPATLINGFYETWPITYAEPGFGYATSGQTIVCVPDATLFDTLIAGESLRIDSDRLTAFERRLDFRRGSLDCRATWDGNGGPKVEVRSRRIVSLTDPHLVAISVEIRTDEPAQVELESRLFNRTDVEPQLFDIDVSDPRRAPALGGRVLNVADHRATGARVLVSYQTERSGQSLACGIDHIVPADAEVIDVESTGDAGHVRFQIEVPAGKPIEIVKMAAYHTSSAYSATNLMVRLGDTLDRAVDLGFEAIAEAQQAELAAFWEVGDIQVVGPAHVQQAVRWNIFQLHQASAQVNNSSIPAKGLSGQAYEGHYFWDTEIYLMPFITYTSPETAAGILRFRHTMLPQARKRADELSLNGALFPWRTINGEAAGAYYPAGTAQFHINADIVYALHQYVEITGGEQILWDIGVEMAAETARLWTDLGVHQDGMFHVHMVTGPDEYTALVNDNAYTNVMARHNLRYAVEVTTRMQVEHPDRYASLAAALDLESKEIREWMYAAEEMLVPYEDNLGVTPQDDSFLHKEPWDFEGTPPEKYPLLLHFHPLVIYRHQVLKQTDVVLATFLLGDEFPPELKRANFDYYDPLTTGDSSLSACVQSIMAAEVGHPDLAMSYFREALLMDLADLAGNTSDGIHLGSAGGVWMCLVNGFGGLRHRDGKLQFDPRLPEEWDSLRFKVLFRATRLAVELTHKQATFAITEGDGLVVDVRGTEVTVVPGEPTSVPL